MKLTRKASPDLIIGGPARANLLPGEVADNKRARGTMRSMITLVVVTVVLCIVGYGGATFLAIQSELALMVEEQRTSDLLAKQAEYSEVQSINNTLSATNDALLAASGPEILWAPYLTDLLAVFPAGMTLKDLDVISPGVSDAERVPSIALEPNSVATIEFTAFTADLNQNAAALRLIEGLPGVASARATPIDFDDTTGQYESKFQIMVTESELAKRFFTADSVADAAATEGTQE